MTRNDPKHPQESPFWRFSLALYARPGVAEACVDLQDRHGVDVNVLLFLLWLAATGRRLSAGEVKAVDDRVDAWRAAAVVPLRALRRKLKGHSSLGNDDAVEELRIRIKSIELDAERLQQEHLYALATSTTLGIEDGSVRTAASDNLAAYQGVLQQQFPPDLVATLLAAMPQKEPAT